MNRPTRRISWKRGTSIGHIAGRIEQPSEDHIADRNLDWGTGRAGSGSPAQACRIPEGDSTHSIGVQMLVHLHQQWCSAILCNFDALVNQRQAAGKPYVDH
jgi:hypothetical protein